jgi:hypothetical protein
MAKQLKLWNGRSHGHKYKRHHVYVAAYSMKQAAQLVSIACYGEERPNLVSTSEIAVYYSKGSWGDKMNGIIATEPCVYLCDGSHSQNNPFKVV